MIFRLVIFIVFLATGPFAIGHHSLANGFDESKEIGFEMVVEDYRFINPHPYITGRLVGSEEDPVRWEIEMDNRWELEAVGFNDSTLVAGDIIQVTGYPGKRNLESIFLRSLDHARLGFRYMHNVRRLFELD